MNSDSSRALPIHPAKDEDKTSFQAWFDQAMQYSAKLDYDGAARHYAPDYQQRAFWYGNLEPALMHGFAEARARQWELVWPLVDGARGITEFEMHVSSDRLWAIAAGGTRFDNKATGATIFTRISYILVRASLDAPWNAVHAHHSTAPEPPA